MRRTCPKKSSSRSARTCNLSASTALWSVAASAYCCTCWGCCWAKALRRTLGRKLLPPGLYHVAGLLEVGGAARAHRAGGANQAALGVRGLRLGRHLRLPGLPAAEKKRRNGLLPWKWKAL